MKFNHFSFTGISVSFVAVCTYFSHKIQRRREGPETKKRTETVNYLQPSVSVTNETKSSGVEQSRVEWSKVESSTVKLSRI